MSRKNSPVGDRRVDLSTGSLGSSQPDTSPTSYVCGSFTYKEVRMWKLHNADSKTEVLEDKKQMPGSKSKSKAIWKMLVEQAHSGEDSLTGEKQHKGEKSVEETRRRWFAKETEIKIKSFTKLHFFWNIPSFLHHVLGPITLNRDRKHIYYYYYNRIIPVWRWFQSNIQNKKQ